MINKEPFDKLLVTNNINQMKEVYNDMAYCMIMYHLRYFKDMIKSLEDQLKKRLEIERQKSKSSFSFQSKFKFKAIKSRPEENGDQVKKAETADVDLMAGIQISEMHSLSEQKVTLGPADIKDTYRLRDLTNCEVRMNGELKTLYLENLVGCRIVCGIIDGALFGNKLENCEIVAAAHQIRIHKAKSVKFCIYVTSNMIIEDSAEVHVKPAQTANFDGELAPLFSGSKFNGATNHWRNVKDFNWIRDDHSPNVIYDE